MPEQTYSIRFVSGADAVPADLWTSAFPRSLEGGWWFAALEQSGLEDQFEFFYALILHDGSPVGVAPLFAMRIEVEFLVPRALVPFLAWLGRIVPALSAPRGLFIGSPCSDEGAIGLLPGADRRQALLALQQALETEAARRDLSLIIWKDFPASYDADLSALAEALGLFRMVGFPGTMLRLPNGSKQDYFAALKSSRRHQLRKKLKRSMQSSALDVEVIQRPDARTLDEIVALFGQTRARAKTSFEELGRPFFERIAQEPVAHFIILRERQTGRAVAFQLVFALGDRVINKYIGIDYQTPSEWFLFFRLFDAAVDWALARGAKSIQSGQTGYRAKVEQGHTLYPLTVYARHRSPMLHGICRMVAKRITWATLDDDLATYLRAHPDGRE